MVAVWRDVVGACGSWNEILTGKAGSRAVYRQRNENFVINSLLKGACKSNGCEDQGGDGSEVHDE